MPMIFTMLGAIRRRRGGIEPPQNERRLDLLLDAIALSEAAPARPGMTETQLMRVLGARD